MKNRFLSIFSLLGSAVMLSGILCGCMDPVNTAENTEKSMTPEFVRTKRVVIDGYLEGRLEYMTTNKVDLPDGLLKIQVTLKSTRTGLWDWLVKGNHPYKIVYRFEWFDKDGMFVNTASSVWLEKEIIPGDTVYISSVAPNQRCKDFMLKLKETKQ